MSVYACITNLSVSKSFLFTVSANKLEMSYMECTHFSKRPAFHFDLVILLISHLYHLSTI